MTIAVSSLTGEGKKRRRVQDEGDVSTRSGEQNKLFHDLRSYFDSKFSEAQKENKRLHSY